LAVAFFTPQYVIEESALPKRSRASPEHHLLLQGLLQHAHPSAQLKVIGPADEQMNMIGHNHVAPYGDVVLRVCAFRKLNERNRDPFVRERSGGDIYMPLRRKPDYSGSRDQVAAEFWGSASFCSRRPVGGVR
jgi:hypothetical protein